MVVSNAATNQSHDESVKLSKKSHLSDNYTISNQSFDFKSEDSMSTGGGGFDLQEPRQTMKFCQFHADQRLEVVCIQDKRKICAKCALFGDHQGHKIRQYEDLIQELTNRSEQTLAIMGQLDDRNIA